MQGRIQQGRRFIRAIEHLAKLCHIAPVQGPLFAFLEACRPCLEMPGVREQLVVWEEEVANRLKLDLVAIRATVRTKASGFNPVPAKKLSMSIRSGRGQAAAVSTIIGKCVR